MPLCNVIFHWLAMCLMQLMQAVGAKECMLPAFWRLQYYTVRYTVRNHVLPPHSHVKEILNYSIHVYFTK